MSEPKASLETVCQWFSMWRLTLEGAGKCGVAFGYDDWEDGSDGEESACNAGDAGLVPALGRLPREGEAARSSNLAWELPRTEQPSLVG